MAKILIATYSMYGAWFSLQLEQEGHSVDVWLMDHFDDYFMVLSGLIKRPLKAKPNFANYDLVLFDLTGRPKIAEEAMLVTKVIGDGNLNSQLEDDRMLGIQVMEECDINVPAYETFNDIGAAKSYLKKTSKRTIFKPNGGQNQDTATTYVSKSAEDMLKYLDKLGSVTKGVEFILQDFVQGTEISCEAWFNGEDFYFINGTLEEKKFLNDNKGPNTGCAGNLVWIMDQVNPPLIYREGLCKLKDFLKQYNYHGMIDLNTIVTDTELYGLEWTPRFGYDASATLYSCINNVGDFLGEVAYGGRPDTDNINSFAAGVRLSIPPYPSEIKNKHPEEIPIDGIDEEDIVKQCYVYDCCEEKGELFTCGVNGLIAVPIANGNSVGEVWSKVYNKVNKIQVPDLQYRTDLEKTTSERYEILSRQGWLR